MTNHRHCGSWSIHVWKILRKVWRSLPAYLVRAHHAHIIDARRCKRGDHVLVEGSFQRFACLHSLFHVGDNVVGSQSQSQALAGDDEMSSLASIPFISINFNTIVACSSRIMSMSFHLIWSFATRIRVSLSVSSGLRN